MSNNTRSEFKFFGRLLGTGTGWDGDLGECWQIYDFQPAAGINLPAHECMGVDKANGNFCTWDSDGNAALVWDIIETLRDIPRA